VGIGARVPLGFGPHGEGNSLRCVAKLAADPQSCKLHQCPSCPYSSPKKDHIMVHFRTHTGERPFPCLSCPARFGTQGTLYNHMRTHTGEKPFVCSICSKAFSLKGNLKHHMLTHQKKSPHYIHQR
ncbi:hypothetical protein SK128_016903, partial [Halocaridina rubra]